MTCGRRLATGDCPDHPISSALEDRRQAAREAYYDDNRATAVAVEAAIETATRVRITPEIIRSVSRMRTTDAQSIAEAAFRAAGFEVES